MHSNFELFGLLFHKINKIPRAVCTKSAIKFCICEAICPFCVANCYAITDKLFPVLDKTCCPFKAPQSLKYQAVSETAWPLRVRHVGPETSSLKLNPVQTNSKASLCLGWYTKVKQVEKVDNVRATSLECAIYSRLSPQ